jgi:serine/threonine protein phosphatase PrpC
MITRAAGLSDPGCKRQKNEDRILVDADRGVFVVADGMGGEHCGELAAEMAVRCVGEYLLETDQSAKDQTCGNSSDSSAQNRVVNAIQLANQQVWEMAQAQEECAGMGTTISVVLVSSESLVIGNIGDSRVYLFRDGQLHRITRDDTLISTLVDEGRISLEKAKAHPLRNVVTLAVGRSKEINVKMIQTQILSGDQLLLSSDGLHGVLSSAEIAEIIGSSHDPDSKAHALVDAAKREGGPDNISCIVVACP